MSKEILLQARDLINQRKYPESRKLLRSIPDDPTARRIY